MFEQLFGVYNLSSIKIINIIINYYKLSFEMIIYLKNHISKIKKKVSTKKGKIFNFLDSN